MIANFENAFKFPFKDKNWIIKILIGGLLIWIPIVNFVVLGYLLKILKDAKEKKEPSLPEWKNWTELFQEGLMVFVIMFCYSIVVFVAISVLARIPIIGCLAIPLLLAAVVLLKPIITIALCFYLENKELGAAFDFKNIIEKFKINAVDYIIVALVMGALLAASGVTLFLAVFIAFYLCVVSYRLLGEIYGS